MRSGAEDVESAGTYDVAHVTKWLAAIGSEEGEAGEAERLAGQAAQTLLDAAEGSPGGGRRDELLRQARGVTAGLNQSPGERARMAEIDGRLTEAAELFEKAGATGALLRTLRKAGNWGRARDVAEGADARDLDWLLKVERLAAARPTGIGERLQPEEVRQLTALTAAMSGTRPRGGRR